MAGVNIVEGIATLSRRAVLDASVKLPIGERLADFFPRPSDTPEAQPNYDRRRDVEPKWSPDGQKILFLSNAFSPDQWMSQVWVMDADGGNKTRLTTGGDFIDAIWGPDGTTVVYVNRIYGKTSIWKMDLVSGDLKPIFYKEGRVPYQPALTPDGAGLTFALGKASPRGYAHVKGNEIWSLDLNGEGRGKMIDNQEFRYLGDLRWSRDGKYLAIEEYEKYGDILGAVWIYDPKTKELKQIVDRGAERVSWSPARDHVLTFPRQEHGGSYTNLWSYDVDNDKFWSWETAKHRAEANYPAWSLDGYGLIYLLNNQWGTGSSRFLEIQLEKHKRTVRIPYESPIVKAISLFDFVWNRRGEIVFSAAVPRAVENRDLASSFIFKITADDQLVQLTDRKF